MWYQVTHPTTEVVEVLTIDGIPLGYALYMPNNPTCLEWLTAHIDVPPNVDLEIRTVASYN